MQELNPGLAERVPDGEMVEPARTVPNYSFQVRKFAGPGYILSVTHTASSTRSSPSECMWRCGGHEVIDPIVGWLDGRGRARRSRFTNTCSTSRRGIDVLKDVLDTFWENPLAFAFLVHNKYRAPLTDVFSGRIYDDMMQDPIFDIAMARLPAATRAERTYDAEACIRCRSVAVPPGAGSPWNSNLQDVESTEEWLRTTV